MQSGWVLDAGSEYGFGSLLMRQANPRLRVLAVDVDRAALRYTKEVAPGEHVDGAEANALRLPVASESMTGVFLINLLHVLDEPGEALGEARRVLRTGGMAVVAIPRGHPAGGASNDELIERLKRLMLKQFRSCNDPEEIAGRVGAFAPRQYRLDRNATIWLAICRK